MLTDKKNKEFRVQQERRNGSSAKASLTVEGAMVLPIFLLAMTALLFLMRGYHAHLDQKCLLDQTVNRAVQRRKLNNAFGTVSLQAEHWAGVGGQKGKGILLPTFGAKKKDIDYTAISRFQGFPNPLFRDSFFLRSRSRIKCWEGDREENAAREEFVYVTATGRVYHESLNCPYLKPSTRGIDATGLNRVRNSGGGRYGSCAFCMKGNRPSGIVYITDYGTAFHRTVNCPGLRREVRRIPRKKAGNRRGCSKCSH